MDLKPSLVVYTTRLNEMTLFKKDISKMKPKDILQNIISESKPRYKANNINKAPLLKLKQEVNEDDDTLNNVNLLLTFDELKLKLEVIKNKTNSVDNEPKVCIKSETDVNCTGISKLETLMALCKPLKIVLEDTFKQVPKTNAEIKTEVLNISSDSDDELIEIKRQKYLKDKATTNKEVTDKVNLAVKSAMSSGKSSMASPVNHIVKNINKFKTILLKDDLRDCVIVIYNKFAKELDAYQIGNCYKVTEYKTRKYTEVYKFPMKKCRLVINIIACCWKNREKYISLLLHYKKYENIAKFISIPHSCKKICACCCVLLEECSQIKDQIRELTENSSVIAKSSINKTNTTFTKNQNLIAVALAYENKSKFKEYPKVASNISVKKKQDVRTLLRLLNVNGEKEFYEIGFDNIIFSKIAMKVVDGSSWLFKTQSKYDKLINLSFSNLIQREKEIKKYTYENSILSYNTECFLRIPMALPKKKVLKNYGEIYDNYSSPYCKVGHVRNFVGTYNKKLKLLPFVSKLRKQNKPTSVVVPSKPPISKPLALSKKQPHKPQHPQPKELPIMNPEVSEAVDSLIMDILHRFRNVLLTIGPDGKVAAALNAPLHTLNPSELKILAQILNHAQTQVDKLGLTPGTRLNLNTPIETTGNTSTICIGTAETSANVATNSEKAEEHDENAGKNIKRQKDDSSKKDCLLNFSNIICNKKKDYKTSFHSYLGDTLEAVPKITNVFSLNNANSITSHSLQDSLITELEDSKMDNPELREITNFNNETDLKDSLIMELHDSNMDNAETPEIGEITNFNDETELKYSFIMEFNDSHMSNLETPKMGEATVLVNETESKKPNKRKRKTFIERSGKKPKIEIETNAEIHVENSSVEIMLTSNTTENVACDPIAPETSSSEGILNSDMTNNPLDNVKDEPNTLSPAIDSQTESKVYFSKIIETCFLNP